MLMGWVDPLAAAAAAVGVDVLFAGPAAADSAADPVHDRGCEGGP